MRDLGLRGLLLGPCLGLGIGVVMLLSTGLIASNGTVPMLVISASLGAIAGGLVGLVGGMIQASLGPGKKPKAVIDEL
jgi:hypothetical protein